MTTASLGSDGWSNEPRYQDAYRLRLDFVLDQVSVLALQDLASSLRKGISCTVSSNYAAGNFNIVKKITFVDEVQWIVRIRLPPISFFESSSPKHEMMDKKPEEWAASVRCTDRDLKALRSEIVTMNYLRKRSSIPIPQVHEYSFVHENSVGFPYIIMDYVHGTTAYHLSTDAGNPLSVPQKYLDHYYDQIANIMVELASLQFNSIGSLTGDPSSDAMDDIKIGPIAETGEGPYETAHDFYTNYPLAIAKALYDDPTASGSGGSEIIRRLPALLKSVTKSSLSTFGLVNLELGTHNALVNASFDVLAVIDWDSVITAPSAVLHQFPWCIGGDPGVPGVGPIKAFGDWDGRMEMCRKFAKELERVGQTFSAAGFFSREALIFRALAFFRVKVKWVDEEWLPGLDWMQSRSDGELLDWYEI